jgi:hypothetical protein
MVRGGVERGGVERGGARGAHSARESRDEFMAGGVFISSLPQLVTDDDLKACFGRYGRVIEVSVSHKKDGKAWLLMEEERVAEELICGKHANIRIEEKRCEIAWRSLRCVASKHLSELLCAEALFVRNLMFCTLNPVFRSQ